MFTADSRFRSIEVKNKRPSPIQITPEQTRPSKQRIVDPTDIRENFEVLTRRYPQDKRVWLEYANWEESQKDFDRVRSVWERALELHCRDDHTMWMKYAEFEMKNKYIDRARNVFDRAVKLLPGADQLWYEYIHMEEMLQNLAGAKQIFMRLSALRPIQPFWLSCMNIQRRNDRGRND